MGGRLQTISIKPVVREPKLHVPSPTRYTAAPVQDKLFVRPAHFTIGLCAKRYLDVAIKNSNKLGPMDYKTDRSTLTRSGSGHISERQKEGKRFQTPPPNQTNV